MAEEPTGIGGWLAALLVAIGGVVPLYYLYLIVSALMTQAQLAEYGAESLPVYWLETVIWMLCLAKLAVAWGITGAMLRFRSRPVIWFAIAGIWLLGIGAIPIDWLALSSTGAQVYGSPIRAMTGQAVAGLILVVPPTLYLLRSRRVANTYPGPGQAQAFAERIAQDFE